MCCGPGQRQRNPERAIDDERTKPGKPEVSVVVVVSEECEPDPECVSRVKETSDTKNIDTLHALPFD